MNKEKALKISVSVFAILSITMSVVLGCTIWGIISKDIMENVALTYVVLLMILMTVYLIWMVHHDI